MNSSIAVPLNAFHIGKQNVGIMRVASGALLGNENPYLIIVPEH